MANRHLEFRVWDTLSKKFVTRASPGLGANDLGPITIHLNGRMGVELEYCCETNLNKHGERFILQQSTGVRDKNGKMVMEGDIVNFQERDFVHERDSFSDRKGYLWKACIVEWNERTAGFRLAINQYRTETGLDGPQLEIIGNVFETPELIQK